MKNTRQWGCLILSGFLLSTPVVQAETVTPAKVMKTYVNLAHASYSDALSTAQALQKSITDFIAHPAADTQQAAQVAWVTARQPYGETEAFRFGNPNVDAWEGQVNSWPLDEGLIDYVSTDAYEYDDGNTFATANVIAGKDEITSDLLKSLNEKGGSETNIGTGYHAIEFLLWGQDLNTDPKSAGTRSHTDFAIGDACTHGNCERRAQYLKVATDLLVADLQVMVDDWAEGKDNYRKTFLALDGQEALRRMLFGMGSLSLGELAGQRMNVALLAHSQEDEHSCFSDNTHHDIADDARGIQNVFNGRYRRVDGSELTGPSLAQLLAEKDAALSAGLVTKLATTQQLTAAIVEAAKQGEHFDQQVGADNEVGNQRVKVTITALHNQAVDIEAAAKALGLTSLSAGAQ